MKLTTENILRNALFTLMLTAMMSMTGCAVRVAPTARPLAVQKHRCHRQCQVHHPRRAPRRNVVVIRR